MRIGDLAARAGVSVRALRYYEEQGLLTSTRTAGGQRTYGEHAPDRVELIQLLLKAGLSSSTIRSVLPCVDHPGVRQSDETLEVLAHERERIDRQIADLTRTRDRLDGVIGSATGYRTSLTTAS